MEDIGGPSNGAHVRRGAGTNDDETSKEILNLNS